MFHCNGWTYPWAVTAIAGTHVCLRKVEPDKIWDLFENEGITHYCAALTVQIPLANYDGAYELDQSSQQFSVIKRVRKRRDENANNELLCLCVPKY
jgi:acyl-CoA synthetase (AMP-forming)/AMP-acid ligase II